MHPQIRIIHLLCTDPTTCSILYSIRVLFPFDSHSLLVFFLSIKLALFFSLYKWDTRARTANKRTRNECMQRSIHCWWKNEWKKQQRWTLLQNVFFVLNSVDHTMILLTTKKTTSKRHTKHSIRTSYTNVTLIPFEWHHHETPMHAMPSWWVCIFCFVYI